MRFAVGGVVYAGPEPSGARAEKLYDVVMSSLVQLGEAGFKPGNQFTALALVRKLSACALREQLLAETFRGWTVDARAYDREAHAEIFPGFGVGPYVAALNVWVQSGFFTVPALELLDESPVAD